MSGDVDRGEWDILYKTIRGPRFDRDVDKGVKQTAVEAKEIVRAATPVKTGACRDSIHEKKHATADWYMVSWAEELLADARNRNWKGEPEYYTPHVEFGHSMPGGGFAGPRAMFASNLARVTALLKKNIDQRIRRLVGRAAM